MDKFIILVLFTCLLKKACLSGTPLAYQRRVMYTVVTESYAKVL